MNPGSAFVAVLHLFSLPELEEVGVCVVLQFSFSELKLVLCERSYF